MQGRKRNQEGGPSEVSVVDGGGGGLVGDTTAR